MNARAADDGTSFDVLIIGGGNAGISAAGRLIRKGVRNIAVMEPQHVHTYRPLLSYVGGGQASMASAERTQRSVTPRHCTWIADSAVGVDADARTVQGASGRNYRYGDLVLVPGLVPDDDELPGIDEALDSAPVASNYLDHADKTWQLVQDLPADGRAIFTVPRSPVSCTGTTIKPLFLAAAHWRGSGRSPHITLVVARPRLLGVPELDERLIDRLEYLGVRVRFGTRVSALHPADNAITVTDRDGAAERLPYEMLHLVPPFRGDTWLTKSKLTGDVPHGLVDIDPHTLKHRTLANIWAAGDCAAVDTDPSGGALRRQISILVTNLLASRNGGKYSRYDGYTVAPVATDAHRLIPAEFDRTGAITSTLPSFLDPLESRPIAWAFDRYALPQVYWHLILKGRI